MALTGFFGLHAGPAGETPALLAGASRPMLLPCVLLGTLLFLSALGIIIATLLLNVRVLVLPPLLLRMLRLLLVVALPPLLLGMLRFGLGLLMFALLLLGMVLLIPVPLPPGMGRSSDSEKHRQNGCAESCNCYHSCDLA